MRPSPEVDCRLEDGGVAVVTIERPAQRNAINRGVIEGLREAWRRIEADDAVRVAILTGAGDKAFCAGMDLKEAAALDAAQRLFEPVYLSEDAQEGPRAFAEKRPPQWRGR